MVRIILGIIASLVIPLVLSAQSISPIVDFEESPGTHNVHLCTDGQNLYTVNGGRPEMGKIFKYTMKGEFIRSYDIKLDMRGVFFYDGKMYVSTYEGDLYLVTNMKKGKVKLVQEDVAVSEQSNVTLIPGTDQTISIYDYEVKYFNLKTKEISLDYQDFIVGDDILSGIATIAASDLHYFTYDANEQEIVVYDRDFNILGDFRVPYGNYGFSLSYADGKVWLSEDGNYSVGHWYGYDIYKALSSSSTLVNEPLGTLVHMLSFEESPGNHNMGLCSDGFNYYTFNGGSSESGVIRQYNEQLELVGKYDISLDMRSGFFDNGWLYVTSYGGDLYKILDFHDGSFEKIFSMLWFDEQASACGMGQGRFAVMSYGEVLIVDLDEEGIVKSYTELASGKEPMTGNSSVAVGDGRIYTFDGESQTLFIYDMDGNAQGSYRLYSGSYGFSLSYAKGMVWVADDGNYGLGHWYGYKIP